jgi:hypothetical protein
MIATGVFILTPSSFEAAANSADSHGTSFNNIGTAPRKLRWGGVRDDRPGGHVPDSRSPDSRLLPDCLGPGGIEQARKAVSPGAFRFSESIRSSLNSTITEQTYYRRRKEYGGMQVDSAKRLKELDQENAKLKRLETWIR